MHKLYIFALASFSFFMACDKNGDSSTEAGTPIGEPITESAKATGAIALAGGGIHVCAILNNNQLKCWGYNRDGQLNINAATNAGGKTFDVSKSQFSQISVGSEHTCGILKGSAQAGLPVCFGGTGPWLNVPEEKVKHIAAGAAFTCFLKENGTIGCVGSDKVGIFSSGGVRQEIRAEDLPIHGIEIGTGKENMDYSTKTFKNIKAGKNRVCGLADDDLVYCMGDNNVDSGKSIAQKAIDYAVEINTSVIITDDKKLHLGPIGPMRAMANLAKPDDLKFKKVFYSSHGVLGYLTASGNTYDDGTAIAEDTLLLSLIDPSLIGQVVDMASNRGGPDTDDFVAYCVLKTNSKVSCHAFKTGMSDNPDSLIVKDIPKEIVE